MANRKRKNRQRGLVDYAVTYAQCREGGHWWEYHHWDADEHSIEYLCTRGCKTVRRQMYDPATMKKIKSRYKYPSGYLMADTTRVDAAVACRRLLERLVKSRGVRFLAKRPGLTEALQRSTKVEAGKTE